MDVVALKFPGCLMLRPRVVVDERGIFIKTFVDDEYRSLRLPTNFAEEYYTHSSPGVIRGLHFQIPPYEYAKLVACINGKMKDVILDLRIGSPFFGEIEVIELDASTGQLLYLPAGIAHGFLAHTVVTVGYKVTSHYAPAFDGGIRWNSVPVDWGVNNPIVSIRDQSFPVWKEFVSPFVYKSVETTE